MFAILKKFVFWFILVFVIVFCFQNMEDLSTQVKFHFDLFVPGQVYETPRFPVIFLLGLFFLMGMLAAGFFGFYEKLARQLDIRKRDRRIRELEQEVAQLRARSEAAAPAPPSATGEKMSGQTGALPLLEENPTL
jgi:uncharacterized integral membrane protein